MVQRGAAFGRGNTASLTICVCADADVMPATWQNQGWASYRAGLEAVLHVGRRIYAG